MHAMLTCVLQTTAVADCGCCLGVRIDDESGSGSMIGCQSMDLVWQGCNHPLRVVLRYRFVQALNKSYVSHSSFSTQTNLLPFHLRPLPTNHNTNLQSFRFLLGASNPFEKVSGGPTFLRHTRLFTRFSAPPVYAHTFLVTCTALTPSD